jgi:hypothetical protein
VTRSRRTSYCRRLLRCDESVIALTGGPPLPVGRRAWMPVFRREVPRRRLSAHRPPQDASGALTRIGPTGRTSPSPRSRTQRHRAAVRRDRAIDGGRPPPEVTTRRSASSVSRWRSGRSRIARVRGRPETTGNVASTRPVLSQSVSAVHAMGSVSGRRHGGTPLRDLGGITRGGAQIGTLCDSGLSAD